MDPTEDFPISGYVRQSRRRAATNQRELAELAGITQSTLSRIEAGRSIPNVATLLRLLRVGWMHLAVVDDRGRWVSPLQEPPETRDLAGRRFPAHLGLILDPGPGEWWGNRFGLVRPPETFHRDPEARRAHRELAHRWRGILCHPVVRTDWYAGRATDPSDAETPWETYTPPWRPAPTEPATPVPDD